ncbi:cell differentiation protein rcd1 [Gossypium raimondii]|uniref:cell differentiation protein rcd1 n=1 Tax=Gossypium raimondii TaxID=29730 RepID=UPI00227CE208|nr:cell differentiation protein rcd1 [Gossypium raimondii]
MVSGAVAPITSNPLVRVRYLIRGVASEETQEQSLDVLCKCSLFHDSYSFQVLNSKKWLLICNLFFSLQNGLAYDNLAVLLWNSFGTMSVLLKIITSAYRPLLSDGLTERAVTQVCNAIALFQCVASHPDTRIPFIRATMPVYLYPFLNTMSNERSYECLRITSLGVIGSLAKVASPTTFCSFFSCQLLAEYIHTYIEVMMELN